MTTSPWSPSARGYYTFALVVLWLLRYNVQWPWEGWMTGIHTEDWRYVLMAKSLGLRDSVGAVYWICCSLIGSHLVPTLLVWFVLSPVQKVWTSGVQGPPLGPLDGVAVTVSLCGIVLQFIADRTLRSFRERNRKKANVSIETQVCSQTCQEGPWRYSRHPNYLGEVLFWTGMNVAAMAGGWVGWNRACAGIINYACFFRVSSSLMDKRSLTNRPGYASVMGKVSALIPCPLIIDKFVDRLLIGKLANSCF
jgi:steroid 5-alpha reductase family enzyme